MSFTNETRRESFNKTLEVISEKKKQVLSILEQHSEGLTAWELSEILNKPVYQVRPRLTELMAEGHISTIGKKHYLPTNRPEAIWAVIHLDEITGQRLLFQGNE